MFLWDNTLEQSFKMRYVSMQSTTMVQ